MYSSERPRQSDPGVCGRTHSSECWGLRARVSFPRLPLLTLFIFALAPFFARSKHRNFSSVLHGNACYTGYACRDCNDFNIGKTKRRLHDRKTQHFKALINSHRASVLADHVTLTGSSLKWDHFEILAKGRSDIHCKIKETLLIKDLKPTLNEYVSSEKLCLLVFVISIVS